MEIFHSIYERIPEHLEAEYSVFLSECGLRDEKDSDLTVILEDDDRIVACGSLCGNVLKQIAVSRDYEGTGLCGEVVTQLISEAAARGEKHLFLFTKPTMKDTFVSFGFFPVINTPRILMLENRRNGFNQFLKNLPHLEGTVGSVVCNCNPFTLGHRYLIEYASKHCDNLLVFVLSEDCSMIPAEDRFELVEAGVADLDNVFVIRGGDYIISKATFPTYFVREDQCKEAACMLDICIFAELISPELKIAVRFLGEEPFDPITADYNKQLKNYLPSHGIRVEEVPRYNNISASAVRSLLKERKLEEVQRLVPATTFEYCRSHFGDGTEVQG